MSTPSRYRPQIFRWIDRVRFGPRLWAAPERLGHLVHFVAQVIAGFLPALTKYRSHVLVAFNDVTWGRGSVVVGGGIAGVLIILGAATGGMIGVLGVTSLSTLNLGAMSGLLSALASTREIAPMIAAVGFAAQAGCRMTAEIGSMRIAEEIDAIEVQGVRPIPFVVTTRVIAGMLAIVPIYLAALTVSYLSAQLVSSVLYQQSEGAYQHYFHMFVEPVDVVYSVVKVLILTVAVIIAHSYYGFYASGGPEGVGVASGRAIRASLVLIVSLDMVLTILMWGFDTAVSFSG
ncbi:ABC transporter permease [Williamsia sp.]|uniref:ABC transporter permease n=1 Tax=Williamsia sp. TaxID=1872085 RepID=UPI002F9323BE